MAVALDEFFQKGFSAARMDDIAARANVSKGTLYLYFDSKESLFKALIENIAMPNLEMIEGIAASAPSVFDALHSLAAFAPKVIRHSNLPRLMKVMIGDSHNFPDIIADYRTRILDRVLRALAMVLANAKQRGEIETDDPALLARLLIAPMVFSGIWQAVFGGAADAKVDLEALFRMHVKIMTKGLDPSCQKAVSQGPAPKGELPSQRIMAKRRPF